MFDAGFRYDLQRAVGEIAVGLRLRDGLTVLDTLRQAGCLKARLPRRVSADCAEVVTLNTSGGVAAGDRLSVRIGLAAGTRAAISAQAAERFYRARPGEGPAQVRTRISVADGALAEWLPQETILFDGAAVDRALDVELEDDARFLGVEMLVFGRTLMGETLRRLDLRDLIRIRRDGRLLVHDAVRIAGDAEAVLHRPALASGRRAVATLFYAAPDAEARLEGVRIALDGAEGGASVADGVLVARILAPDGAALRRAVAAVLMSLRERALPRVWMC